jgi:outer membrane protein
MKNIIRSFVMLAAFGAFALAARAEPAVKILVVDMAKLYDNHYLTQEQNAKLQADQQKAREIADKLNKENDTLVEEFKNLQDQTNNAALTAEAKAKAQNDAQKKVDEIQAKRNELATFVQNTQQSLQQRLKTFQNMMLEEITKIATDVAKRHGATLLIDKSGPSMIGVPSVLYVDASYDITDEVMAEINKTRPPSTATPTAPSSSAPSSSAAPSSSSSTPAPGTGPSINLPIAPKK